MIEEEKEKKNKMIRGVEKRLREKEMITEKVMKNKMKRQRRREGYNDDGRRND